MTDPDSPITARRTGAVSTGVRLRLAAALLAVAAGGAALIIAILLVRSVLA